MWKIKSPNYLQIIGAIKVSSSFPKDIKVRYAWFLWLVTKNHSYLEYELQRPNLRHVKIKFNAPVFDKVTKDRAAKFVDQLSAIGGTMGLLTGFSIISGVEIVYFAVKIAVGCINNFRGKVFKE